MTEIRAESIPHEAATHESSADSTYLFQDVQVQSINMNEGGSAWIKVCDASRLFESFREAPKFQPTAKVSIEGDPGFKVLDADFEQNKILLETKESRSVKLSDGAIIVHLGDAPLWRMLSGKGGYDRKHEALYLTHIQSNLMVELGYGSVRVRARQDGEILFVSYDGELLTDEGVSWARYPRTKGMDEYEASWFAPLTARDLETIGDVDPLGKGRPVTVERLRMGCWVGSVTAKGMIVFKNFNCNYTMHGDEDTDYPISVFLNPSGMMLFITSSDSCILAANREVKTMPKEEALTLLRKFLSLKPLVPYRAKAARKHRRSSVSSVSDGASAFSRASSSEDAFSRASSSASRAARSRRRASVAGGEFMLGRLPSSSASPQQGPSTAKLHPGLLSQLPEGLFGPT